GSRSERAARPLRGGAGGAPRRDSSARARTRRARAVSPRARARPFALRGQGRARAGRGAARASSLAAKRRGGGRRLRAPLSGVAPLAAHAAARRRERTTYELSAIEIVR